MNVRRALAWFRGRLVALAEAGALRVRHGARMVEAVDADDVDAWLIGVTLPSLIARRAEAPSKLAALGVGVG